MSYKFFIYLFKSAIGLLFEILDIRKQASDEWKKNKNYISSAKPNKRN